MGNRSTKPYIMPTETFSDIYSTATANTKTRGKTSRRRSGYSSSNQSTSGILPTIGLPSRHDQLPLAVGRKPRHDKLDPTSNASRKILGRGNPELDKLLLLRKRFAKRIIHSIPPHERRKILAAPWFFAALKELFDQYEKLTQIEFACLAIAKAIRKAE